MDNIKQLIQPSSSLRRNSLLAFQQFLRTKKQYRPSVRVRQIQQLSPHPSGHKNSSTFSSNPRLQIKGINSSQRLATEQVILSGEKAIATYRARREKVVISDEKQKSKTIKVNGRRHRDLTEKRKKRINTLTLATHDATPFGNRGAPLQVYKNNNKNASLSKFRIKSIESTQSKRQDYKLLNLIGKLCKLNEVEGGHMRHSMIQFQSDQGMG